MSAAVAVDVRTCRWREAEPALRDVRRTVFVVEQGVPEWLEWDDLDDASLHALAVERSGRAVGCARLLPDGHIGRVAVLAAWRGRRVGSALLQALVAAARERGDAHVAVNAQIAAMPFYARHGFVARGDVFVEAGIPHRAMELAL